MDVRLTRLPRTRVHDLRHLHASVLLAAGQPVPLVAARLGHASPAVTMSVYAHALRGQDEMAVSVLDADVSELRVRSRALRVVAAPALAIFLDSRTQSHMCSLIGSASTAPGRGLIGHTYYCYASRA